LAVVVVAGHAIKHVFNSGLRSLLLPEIKIGLGLTGTQYGALYTANQITSWGTTIGAGYLGDRFSNRAALMLGISLATTGISFFIAGHAATYTVMLLAMLLVGMGPSLYHPPALGELSRQFPDKRGFAISLHGMGGNAGEVLGPLVTAGMLGLASWRGVLQISLVPALLAGVLIWVVMRSIASRQPQSASTRAYFSTIGEVLRDPVMVFLVVISVIRSVGEAPVTSFLPVYLREDLGFSKERVAVYLSLSQVAGLVTQPVFGHASDTYGRKAVLLPGVAAVALLSFGFAGVEAGLVLMLLVIAKGAFSFPLHHMFIAAGMDVARGNVQSTVVSLIYGAGFLGTFSPLLAGHLVDRFGIHSAFLYGGAVSLLSAAMLVVLRLPKTSRQLEEASG
jgi:MFS family permease